MPSQVLSERDSRLARNTLSRFRSDVSRPTIWDNFSRAPTRSPARSGISTSLTAASKPRVARVVEAKAAVAINESQRGSRSNRATNTNATVADKRTKMSDSIMPARKSRRALPLRSNRSPCEMILPMATTGWGSQRGSPTARSSTKAPTKRAAEGVMGDCQSIDRPIPPDPRRPRFRGK